MKTLDSSSTPALSGLEFYGGYVKNLSLSDFEKVLNLPNVTIVI